MKMDPSRRRFLHRALFGAGGLGLASLATGIPRGILADPLASRALAQEGSAARILILSTSAAGDPLNGNVPGTYGPGNEALLHPLDQAMAPTEYMLGDQRVTAAKPWAELPESIRSRMAFFHHGTYANTHPSQPKVMRLTGGMNRNDMLVSFFAQQLAPRLETTQTEPLSLGATGGGELLSFQGRTLSGVKPLALKQVLGHPEGPLGQLQALRDRRVDELHALFREHGTQNHERMLERFAVSRNEAREISLELLGRLEAVTTNRVEGQIIAAPVLAAMNVAPVITIRIPFGGDNHIDPDLERETSQTLSGLGHLTQLMENIDRLRAERALTSEVVVANMNVFGRTLARARKGQHGRDHNGNHHVTVLVGDPIKPAVVGGVRVEGDDYGASEFDSATGAPTTGGDIGFFETFGSMAKTLGRALGVEQDILDTEIAHAGSVNGKTIDVVLRNP